MLHVLVCLNLLVTLMATYNADNNSCSDDKTPFSAVLISPEATSSSLTIPYTAVGIDSNSDSDNNDDEDDNDDPLTLLHVEELLDNNADGKRTKRKLPNNPREQKAKKKGKKETRVFPNAFVALPIKSVSINQQIEQIQNHMLQKDPKVKRALIPLNRLHITLMVMRLSDQDSIEK